MFARWRASKLLDDVRACAEDDDRGRLVLEDLADKFARVGLGQSPGFMPAELSLEALPESTRHWMRRNESRPVHIPLQFHLRVVCLELRNIRFQERFQEHFQEHRRYDCVFEDRFLEPTLRLIAEFLCGEYAHDFYCAPRRILDKFGVTAAEKPLLPSVFKTSAEVARGVARS